MMGEGRRRGGEVGVGGYSSSIHAYSFTYSSVHSLTLTEALTPWTNTQITPGPGGLELDIEQEPLTSVL